MRISDWSSDVCSSDLFFRGAAPGQLPGEKSADYLAHPDAARRIADLLPDIPLVVQLRNPVDRAYSDYRMLYRRGTVRGRPEDYLIRSTTPMPRFLDDGLYFEHLKRWLDYFPRRQIKDRKSVVEGKSGAVRVD